MSTTFDPYGRRDLYAPPATDVVHAAVLAANTSKAMAVPAGANYVNFAGGGDFYARFQTSNTAIAIPSADVTNGTAPILNPGTRTIPVGTTHIVLIAPATNIVTLEFYA
jgi:hypothetical protein